MAFPDDQAKLKSGRISPDEKLKILNELGKIAQEKYDEYIVAGGNAKGYNLIKLRGSLQFIPIIEEFENQYFLQGKNQKETDIANYFEYGTGLYNTKRAGKYRAGYIRPVSGEYMQFVAKDGKFVTTAQVKGVHPIFAMTKAVKYVTFHRKSFQREIRLMLNIQSEADVLGAISEYR